MNKEIREQVISPEVIHSEKTLYLSPEGKNVSLPRVLIDVEDIKIACFQQPDGMVVINIFQEGKKVLYDSEKEYELKDGQKLDLQKIIEENYSQKYSSKINSNRMIIAEQYENARRQVEEVYVSPETGGSFKDLPGLIQYFDPASLSQNLKYEVEITAETPPSLKVEILNYKRIKSVAEEVLKRRIAGRPLTKNQIEKLKLLILDDLSKENANIKYILQSKARQRMEQYSNDFLKGKDDKWNPEEVLIKDPLESQIIPNIYKPMIFGPIIGTVDGMMDPTSGIIEKKSLSHGIIDNEPERKATPRSFDILRKEASKFAKSKIGIAVGGLTAVGTAAALMMNRGQMPEMAYNPTSPESNIPKTELNVEQKPLGAALPPPSKLGVDNRPDTTQVEKVKIATTEAQAKTKISFYRETPNSINTSVSQISEQINWTLALKIFDSIDKNKTFSTEFQRAGGYEGLKKIGAITESTLSGITTVEINMPRFKSIPTIPRKN
jgi:hypothetical protein